MTLDGQKLENKKNKTNPERIRMDKKNGLTFRLVEGGGVDGGEERALKETFVGESSSYLPLANGNAVDR